MQYEVTDIQHQTHSSAAGSREAVVFTVVYTATDSDFKSTAYLEFNAETPDEEIAATIESHGKMLSSKGEKTYSFAKSGVIE
ncbi:hypothetical protein AUC31_17560 [Planococcus rifietoensis]|uniref:Uncharacterized protein n=1 Tax=Planococcus rifietoensis TaxID=200991 RepID=A0A0U2ZCB0_9BACL|nr:hypothetical protein [Planococcus rifietoensis]ALS76916.1 hypothetical protein AUC31_17560 [Planococcus rifietoensis]